MSLTVKELSPRRELPQLKPMISLNEVLTVAFRVRRRVVVAFVLPLAAVIVLLAVMPKVYRAESDILVKTGREYLSSSEGDNVNGGSPTSTKQEDINSEISLLTSRSVSQATIDSIGLKNIFPDLVNNPPTSMTLDDAAVEKFDAARGASPVKMSNVVSTTFDAPSPQQAQAVLDRLIQLYIAKHTQVFADSRTEGYENSIKTVLADIDRLETQRTKIKVDNGIYDISVQRTALINQKVNAQTHLQEITDSQNTLTKRLAYLTSVRSQIPATMQSTNTDKSEEAVHAREALVDLRQMETALAARYADGNPDLQRVRAQIATLRQTLAATSSSKVGTTNAPSPLRQQVEQEIVMDDAQLAPLDVESGRYRMLISKLDAELQRLESADLALRTTTSRLDALSDNLKSLQVQFQQARTREQTELAKQVSIVQVAPAIASARPVKPKKSIFLGAGLMCGILLAGGVVVASVLLNKTVVTDDAAERLFGLPVLVSMPLRNRRAGQITLEME